MKNLAVLNYFKHADSSRLSKYNFDIWKNNGIKAEMLCRKDRVDQDKACFGESAS